MATNTLGLAIALKAEVIAEPIEWRVDEAIFALDADELVVIECNDALRKP